MKKSKKPLTQREKKVLDIENWGQLTLFQHLKDCWDSKMERQRNVIFSMGAEQYSGSNLETHDKYVNAVNSTWDREFTKLYNSLHSLLPFLAIAKGIPNNWPGECILRFDQREDGSIYLSYYGINEASDGITIKQWRSLLRVFTDSENSDSQK